MATKTKETLRRMKYRLQKTGVTGAKAGAEMKKAFESPLDAAQFGTVIANDRRCRGPLFKTEKDQRAAFDLWYKLEGKDWDKAIELLAHLVTAAQKVADAIHGEGFKVTCASMDKGDWDALRRVVFPFIRLRGQKVGKPCGWDMNEEIVTHPWDGKEHETKCPRCGNVIGWKAAVPL